MGSKVSKPAAAPSASANTGAGTGLTQLAASTPLVAPATAAPAALETISEVTNAQQIQRGSRIRVLKDSRTRARMRRNRNHRSHRRQRNRHGSRSRSRK
jgi:hypothetical protein